MAERMSSVTMRSIPCGTCPASSPRAAMVDWLGPVNSLNSYSQRRESNPQPRLYKSRALPLSYAGVTCFNKSS